ncbi:MAG: mechanosensitive ion channel family protein [Cytophagia bacterium]|nr:MAG: mechanosensitive ion channel family protein [Cytophagia bacterium]TAG42451.1 MAG: mechanosensitive ion channel family protein [Cytophagia bacterium]TAH30407.1 MAG: mechanosensitive ion channel family protein [Cytophagales bacterium]
MKNHQYYCYYFVILFFFFSFFQINAQSLEQEKKRANTLLSPFHAVYLHIYHLNPQHYRPDSAAKALNPYFGGSQARREELAIQLGQILDGNGLYYDFQKIPKESLYRDTIRKKNIFVPFPKFPEIYLEKVGHNWFYSRTTIESIPYLYEKTFPFDTEYISRILGANPIKRYNFFGLNAIHYAGLLFLVIIPFILYTPLAWFLALVVRLLSKLGTNDEERRIKVTKLVRPISLFLIFILLEFIIPIWQFPALISFYLFTITRIMRPVFAVLAVNGIIRLMILYLQKKVIENPKIWYSNLVPFMSTTLQVLTIVIGVLYMLEALSINVVGVLAGLSIGGLAVALAAQDTIKNLFGSLTIFLDKPFKVGDWITAEGIDGDVEEIGVRSTRIRTFHHSLLYVPNGKLADMIVDNLGLRVYRRYRTTLSLTYSTHPFKIKAFVEALKQIVLRHEKTRKDFFGIYFQEYGAHSLNIMFNIFFTVGTFEEEWAVREEINLLILELAHELNINFAFPTQTLHLDKITEKPTDNIPNFDTLTQSVERFLNRKGLEKVR